MQSSNLKIEFEHDGFVVIRDFLRPDALHELQNQLNRYIREVVPKLPSSDAFYEDRSRPESLKQLQRMDCDSFFNEYKRNEPWAALAETLLGESAVADPPEWFNKPPGTNHVTPP